MKGLIVLAQHELCQHEMHEFFGKFEEIRIAMKVITGYGSDNSVLKWTNIFGDGFSIGIYRVEKVGNIIGKNRYTLSVWNFAGTTFIGDIGFEVMYNEKVPGNIYEWLYNITKDYSMNKVKCSGCKKVISTMDIAGRYFAGVYCEDCWESKYKAIEARENYE